MPSLKYVHHLGKNTNLPANIITVEERDQRMPFLRHRDLFVGFNFILERKNLQKYF